MNSDTQSGNQEAAPYVLPPDVKMNGFATVPVRTNEGKETSVKLYLCKVSAIQEYIDVGGELAKFVAFNLRQPVEFVDSLDVDSVFKLDELARTMNDPIADRLLKRQGVVLDRQLAQARGLKRSIDRFSKQ